MSDSTIFHITENYLKKKYIIRYNTVSLAFEIKLIKLKKWQILNEDALFVELQKQGIKISIGNLLSILKSDFVPKYSPIKEYFKNLPKHNINKPILEIFANHIKANEQAMFLYHFKKWLVRCVKCSLSDSYFNKQAFILVHNKQNSGKTTFCRYLCPPVLSQYLAEDVSTDKDARILVAKNYLINLDELALLSRREINSLKSLFSKTQINERLPYDKKNTQLPRIASFVGSTNQNTFLNDETGSVRWLCFGIKKIDWNYNKIQIDDVWAEAYHLANDKGFDSELTVDDIRDNEKRNKQYQQLSVEQDLISKYVTRGSDFFTATDVMLHLQPLYPRINKIQVGKALTSLSFDRIKNSKTQQYGYYLNLKDLFNPLENLKEKEHAIF